MAGQNVTWTAEEGKIETICEEGYYGQEAWTVLTSSDNLVCEECTDAQLACREVYNETTGVYDDAALVLSGSIKASSCMALDGCVKFSDPIAPTSTIVTEDDDERKGSTTGNCSAVTRENEYCVACPAGATCPAKVIYPVEPVSNAGYWRVSLPYDNKLDVCDDRDQRTECYSG